MTSVSRETAEPDRSVLERLFPGALEGIYRYVDLLTGAGVERGLLGPREAPRVWQRHILNCAVVAPVLSEGATVCDIGSGAGLPGVVLALARPDLHITLLEPLQRRVTFLDEVVRELELADVRVVRGRAEDRTGTVAFDVVTARAVAPLGTLIRWGLPLVSRGGELVAFKGSRAQDELTEARPDLARAGAGRTRIETYGDGVVDPVTTVVRIESGGRRPARKKGSR